jgi:hypothetical protein
MNMTSQTHPQDTAGHRRLLVEALIGYGVFCALGWASRFIPAAFFLFVETLS